MSIFKSAKNATPSQILKKASARILWIVLVGVCLIVVALLTATKLLAVSYDSKVIAQDIPVTPITTVPKDEEVTLPPLDKDAYDKKMLALANHVAPPVTAVPVSPKAAAAGSTAGATAGATTGATPVPSKPLPPPKKELWPVTGNPYPLPGAILPDHRIIAYYGNFYSKGMGVLGQYPKAEMLSKLNVEVAKWNAADPTTPVIPAIDYIAVTAQGTPSIGGKYRLRMPATEIQKAVDLANEIHGIVILEIQPGTSTMEVEIPMLADFLKLPNVHLALDPEFTMHGGAKPGSVIGSLDATDINWAANYLADIVRTNNLPPKVLIVHRFTGPMVTHADKITPLPEVQILMDMDGWGSPAKKIGTYNSTIYNQPVQFTGFKLFYKNDLLPPSTRMLTPLELLKLQPQPSFIQFQ